MGLMKILFAAVVITLSLLSGSLGSGVGVSRGHSGPDTVGVTRVHSPGEMRRGGPGYPHEGADASTAGSRALD